MRLISKIMALCLLAQNVFAAEAAIITYDEFQTRASHHRKSIEVEGLSYMVGGVLGLGTSLALDITSKEVFPKLGYTLIQTLSTASMIYGGIRFFTGDEFTSEAEALQDYNRTLANAVGMAPQQKKKILDQATKLAVERARHRELTIRRIRGTLELVTAASAGTSIGFSKVTSTASNITLGFIVLIATAGGVTDLLGSTSDLGFGSEAVSSLHFDLLPDWEQRSAALALRFDW